MHSHREYCCLQECVWGVAYEIPAQSEEWVRQHLDLREQGGYEVVTVSIYSPEVALISSKSSSRLRSVSIIPSKHTYESVSDNLEEMSRRVAVNMLI